jgi:hypothetical protein
MTFIGVLAAATPLLIAAVTLGAAPAAAQDKAAKDQLVGAWSLVSISVGEARKRPSPTARRLKAPC